ncbi:NERD domain-containing protein [Sanguibacter massiliensis]|uniref:NERD domain-containing protein n=1 Tax=Sanguibacter massiliensis TaxID=1973217 RepID=UPI000C84AA4B|nr:NERD domain-containing protein [Sanguibacter massiliensis]
MPILLPNEPEFPDDGGAERAVWETLRTHLPDDALLVAGQRIQDGETECELDLVVAWPGVGVAVLEVKGGIVTREEGAWWQGSGDARHRVDPVGQAQRGRHALQDLLGARRVEGAHARSAHLVAFPHTYVPATWDALDLPRALVVDRADVEDGPAVVARVRRAILEHGQGRTPLASVEGVLRVLDPVLTGEADSPEAATAHELRSDQLTKDQAAMLDKLRAFPRLRVVGGAGTGKTYLALAQARRRTREGDRVALLCYSRGLAAYLQQFTAGWPARERPAYVGLFHDLPLRWGAEPGTDDDGDYWERRLPLRLAELADAQPTSERFDTIVVDEGQDFGELWWPGVLRCLRDPERGRLYVFMDDNQRVFPRDGSAPIDLPPVELDENLRSTKQIAQLFGSLSGTVLKARGADGPPVRIVDVPAEDAVGHADTVVDQLLDAGYEPGRVALLTTGRRHPVQVERVESVGYPGYWGEFLAGDDVFYGHVLGFKGLERSAVVLAGYGLRGVARAREMLYAGLSRARSLLVVVGPRDLVVEHGGAGVARRLDAAHDITATVLADG